MDNYDLIENNEVGKNAMGGTEMYMRFVYNGVVPRHLLENVQIIPSRLRELKDDKIRIWFEHNLANDPESMKALKDQATREKFHKIVFLSNWHYNNFMNFVGVPYSSQCCVIEGGMDSIKSYEDDPQLPKKPDPNECVHISYHTTPHRGLELLVPVFLKLAEEDKKIHLHVHSSFKMYGWDEMDQKYQNLFDICKDHPQITYHGYTKYDDLTKLLNDKYHIYAYPNIWPETMCRSLIEGMYFGLVCVHPDFAALADTTGSLNKYMYNGTGDRNEHANIHYHYLKKAIEDVRGNSEEHVKSLAFNRQYIQNRYNTAHVHSKWTSILEQLNAKYPTVESRKHQELFVYKV